MANSTLHKKASWLSLVAETAGLAGETRTRVELVLPATEACAARSLRATVQIVTPWGDVVATRRVSSPVEDFYAGLRVDIDCDLMRALGSTVVAWLEPSTSRATLDQDEAQATAVACAFEPTRAIKLMLRAPSAPDLTRPPRLAKRAEFDMSSHAA